MGVLLQGFYKRAAKIAVPSPVDSDSTVEWWWDHLARQANALALAGFSAIWLPPVLKDADGPLPAADGYSPYDDYDIGSKDQNLDNMKGVPTRFGTREQLQRCVAILRANGIDVYVDMVEHHRSGDPGATRFVFNYPGSSLAPLNANPAAQPIPGRFPKNPNNFLPQVPRDPNLGGPVSDDRAFGRELAPINGLPFHSVADHLTAAADWLTRALGIQGYRIDDAKGLSTDFLLPFLNSDSMAGKFAVGEFFDGDRGLVNGWITNPKGMQGRASAFDFPLKFNLNSMCNNPGRFNMATLDHVGLAGIAPLQAVTFVENHDTDLDPTQNIVTNKIQAYAYILTSEGYPCVFYRDYSTDPGCHGLKPQIDNLIWIHEKIADGPTQARWQDFNVFAYERLGGSHLLVGLNNDPSASHTITVATGFGPNIKLHDYTGNAPADVTTDASGNVTITIPANAGGKSFVCYSVKGIAGGLVPAPQVVNQDFEGDADLDLLPIIIGGTIDVGQIWSAANQPIAAALLPDKTQWPNDVTLTLGLRAPDNTVVAQQQWTPASPGSLTLNANSGAAGFYKFEITATQAAINPAFLFIPFKLSVRYQADPIFTPPKPPVDPTARGKWSDPFNLANVGIHAHMLPTGEVLYWGRRQKPADPTFNSLNERQCFPFLFNPLTRACVATPQPKAANGTLLNLFCSNHTFLPDGRLMVTGGHYFDSQGIEESTIYDPATNSWAPGPVMGVSQTTPDGIGRWYPTVVTLPDGSALVCGGSFAVPEPPPPLPPLAPNFRTDSFNTPTNNTPENWVPGAGQWNNLRSFSDEIGGDITLFPRMHVAPDGRVFVSGTAAQCYFFDPNFTDANGRGKWTKGPSRQSGPREYAPSVMYDVGNIIYIGGGNNANQAGLNAPTDIVEVIDLIDPQPSWIVAQPMHYPRRQHNATILPDGTVLVTGGTRGPGFNDVVDPAMPVHTSELWDPATGNWTLMADESVDRCYHSTAVLLPDATVISAGGGEYEPVILNPREPNPANQSHQDAQIFQPPYLFRGPRPVILNPSAQPIQIIYGQPFEVAYQPPQGGKVIRASMVRLSSVTHSFNQNQRINFPDCAFPRDGVVTITTPPNANACPPGHYMLFLLSDLGVPSVAQFVQVTGQPAPQPHVATPVFDAAAAADTLRLNAVNSPVNIGLTSMCPYGCFGNALTVLPKLQDVKEASPEADTQAWMVTVYLDNDGLPDIEKWREQITQLLGGSYIFRGVEITIEGPVELANGVLTMPATPERPAVTLVPLQNGDLVQMRAFNGKGAEHNPTTAEAQSFANLLQLRQQGAANAGAVVTGPLQNTPAGPLVKVREFQAL